MKVEDSNVFAFPLQVQAVVATDFWWSVLFLYGSSFAYILRSF